MADVRDLLNQRIRRLRDGPPLAKLREPAVAQSLTRERRLDRKKAAQRKLWARFPVERCKRQVATSSAQALLSDVDEPGP